MTAKASGYTPEQTEKMFADYQAGITPEAIAQAMDKSIRSVIAKLSRGKKSHNKKLLTAILASDAAQVRQILERGAYLDDKVDGCTILMKAVESGNIEIISLLLQSGANINQRSDNLMTPLANAALGGAVNVFNFLVSSGADVNLSYEIIINRSKVAENSLLLLAAIGGSVDICRLLISQGSDIEMANEWGYTPLIFSLHVGKLDILDFLISAGANPDPGSRAKGLSSLNWMTPLMVAASKGLVQPLKSLLKAKVDVNRVIFGGLTALKCAAKSGEPEAVQVLLEAGANVDPKDGEGWTPLMSAATEGNAAIVALLLKHGADPRYAITSTRSPEDKGRTALMNAALNGQFDVVKLLLQTGVDVNADNQFGTTALSHAISARSRSNSLNTLSGRFGQLLSSTGKIASEFGSDLSQRSLQVINVLLENGADPDVLVDAIPAMKMAINLEDQELIDVLKNYGARTDLGVNDPKSAIDGVQSSKLTVLKSKGTQRQIAKALTLKAEIIRDLNSVKQGMSADASSYINELISTIELSNESFNLMTERREPDYDNAQQWHFNDRSAGMVCGPFFTTQKFPRDSSWMPVIQLDLREVSGLTDMNFGDGLLQVWYEQGADPEHAGNATIVVIPRAEVREELLTEWNFFYYPEPCEIDVSPIPSDWASFFWSGEVRTHVITGVVSKGFECPDKCIENILDSIASFIPHDLGVKIRDFIELCRYSIPSGDQIDIVGLFGTFESEKYTASDIGLKCLFSVIAWNDDAEAQLFYDIDSAGNISYSFKDFWTAPGYDIEDHKKLYRGISC